MNTLAHIAAMVALLWAAIAWCLNTLQETELAYAVFAVFFVWFALTIRAIFDDIADGFERAGRKKRER